MSAIVGLATPNAITIITDAASTCVKTGVLVAVHPKQVINLRTGTVVAGIGTWGPVKRFASLAERRGADLDELERLSPELWAEAVSSTAPAEKVKTIPLRHMVLYAGWSSSRRRLVMNLIDDGRHEVDIPGWLGGPARTDQFKAYIAQFSDGFDFAHDGLSFFQTIRREHPMEYEGGTHPAVGGFVQATTLTGQDISTACLHVWPDMIGRHIDASDPGWPFWPTASPADVAWALHKPERADLFDRKFGPGALARLRESA